MDRSVNSIGSCSLDVDADSSDISDTSGSLNFPTPRSVKDITQEFTSNIRERCSPRMAQNSNEIESDNSALPTTADLNSEIKPSYLSLACCVNGYSNLTTYDSKTRQDINKSREVSPIRPSASGIQHCKKSNSLAPPVLLIMPDVKSSDVKQSTVGNKYAQAENNNNLHQNGDSPVRHGGAADKSPNASFIQQRVEQLYGPGALAQGFYNSKTVRITHSGQKIHIDGAGDNAPATELTLKYQQLSPSKDYSDFSKKLSAIAPSAAQHTVSSAVDSSENNSIDLPCLRHLSQEFRAQLPTISPKRNFLPKILNEPDNKFEKPSRKPELLPTLTDEVDHKLPSISNSNILTLVHDNSFNILKDKNNIPEKNKFESQSPKQIALQPQSNKEPKYDTESASLKKDGNYFLCQLKNEQARILSLADDAEKYILSLTNNPDVTEDTFGFLRSASGKGRLLVSQKMKQFEGLCHNNLNPSPEDKFPTTVDDLQGFWDMINLQVDHINSIFAEIEVLKSNNWQKPQETNQINIQTKQQKYKAKIVVNPKPKSSVSDESHSKKMSAAALKRESQRKELMEMKRKNRIAMAANSNNTVDIGSDDVSSKPVNINNV